MAKQESVKPLLSLCIIARDAGASIQRCIDSVDGVCDEVVVLVDSRTTDNTQKLLDPYGSWIKSAPYQWHHDFSAARDAAIALATGKYMMWMDADEELAPGAGEKLLHQLSLDKYQLILCANAINESYQMPEYDLDGFGEGVSIVKPRVVINEPGLHWQYRCHECIAPAPDSIHEVLRAEDIQVLHHGDMTTAKAEYYKALLQLDYVEDPGDPHAALYLGTLAIMDKRWQLALKYLEGIDESRLNTNDPGQRQRYYFFQGQAWQGMASDGLAKDARQQWQYFAKALENYGNSGTSMARVQAAVVHLQTKGREDALRILEMSHQADPDHLLLKGLLEVVRGADPEKVEDAVVIFFTALSETQSPKLATQQTLAVVKKASAIWVPDNAMEKRIQKVQNGRSINTLTGEQR